MAMAMMLGSLLAVLLAVSATRTHAAKIQQRRAAESMQLEQMQLAAMLRLRQAAQDSTNIAPKVVIEWDPAAPPRDVTDASDRQDPITKGWRVIARFAEPTIEGQSIEGQSIEGQSIEGQSIEGQSIEGQSIEGQLSFSHSGKRDVVVEVESTHSRRKWIGRLDLEEDGKSNGRSTDDRIRDSRNESEVP
jgi:type II secretory pathway pseudopilin PulG